MQDTSWSKHTVSLGHLECSDFYAKERHRGWEASELGQHVMSGGCWAVKGAEVMKLKARPTSASLDPLVQILWVIRVIIQAVPCRECDILRFTALRNSCSIIAKRLCAGNLRRDLAIEANWKDESRKGTLAPLLPPYPLNRCSSRQKIR